jgi:hypothetical protein
VVRTYPPRITPRLKRPSFPTVISLLALFIALGGTSYAVIKLPASSVGTRELKHDAVTASKIRDGSVGATDLAPDAAGRRGPRGPEGPPGSQGPAGPSGATAAPEPWHPLTFAGSWTNWASGYATGAYRRDVFGQVYLRGSLTKNAGSPAAGDVIATLPVGYRPPQRLTFAVVSGASNQYGGIDIVSNGDIAWYAGGVAEPDYTSLTGISFSTDP